MCSLITLLIIPLMINIFLITILINNDVNNYYICIYVLVTSSMIGSKSVYRPRLRWNHSGQTQRLRKNVYFVKRYACFNIYIYIYTLLNYLLINNLERNSNGEKYVSCYQFENNYTYIINN